VVASESADMAAAITAPTGATLNGVGQASGKTQVPDVWLPDSSIWLQRVRTAGKDLVPTDAPSVARSPVVLAMPEPVAALLGGGQTKLTWPALLAQVTTNNKLKVGIVDPSRDASGLSGLLALAAAAQASGANAQQASTAALRALAQGRAALRDELLRKFPRASDPTTLATSLSVAPLSEQAVISYNAAAPPVRLAALYVEPAPFALDYPFTIMVRDVAKQEVAAAYRAALSGDGYRNRLAAIGMRAADGTVGQNFQAGPSAPKGPLQAGAAPDIAAVDRLLSTWVALTLPARMLAVLDVSGSMNATVPTAKNATRMQVTVEAARQGLSLLDDSWAVGVWTFSTNLDGAKDYKELVPIGPLSSQRATMLQQLGGVKAIPQGDTGLYDTILAGYKAVQTGWDPGRINSLVIMTDGENDDDNGILLPNLLVELKKIMDPAKPIQVILIGIGSAVGQAEMKQVTDTTGGGTFLAPDPAKIGQIFLQAIALRTITTK
jgi:Ca-activated chloride channel homolog